MTGAPIVASLALFLTVAASASFLDPVREKLSNGVEVAWFEDDRVPVLDLYFVSMTGSESDPRGLSGTSALLSAFLERVGDVELESIGGDFTVNAQKDLTIAQAHGLSQDWKRLLGAIKSTLLEAPIESSKASLEKARLTEARRRLREEPDALATYAIDRLVRTGTPYLYADYWRESEFARIDAEVLEKRRREIWQPSQVMVLAVGRLDRHALKAALEEMFRSWKPSSSPIARIAVPHPIGARAPREMQFWYIDQPGLNQAQIRWGKPIAGYTDPDRHAVTVLNSLFGGSSRSRLSRTLRDKLGWTYGVATFTDYSRHHSWAGFASSTSNANVGKFLRESFKLWNALGKEPVLESEFKEAKDALIGVFPVANASPGAIAARWLAARLFGLPEEDLSEQLRKLEGVKLEDVARAARAFASTESLQVVVVGDWKAIRPLLEKEGFRNWKPFRDLR